MNDKTFRIVVIALLLLILGSVIGSFSSSFFDEDKYLEFEDGEFIEDDNDYYQFDRLSYGEFSAAIGQPIDDLVDVNKYAQESGYEIVDDFSTFYRDSGCHADELGRFLCFEETLEVYEDEKVIERTIIGNRDE